MKKNYLIILIFTLIFCWFGSNNAMAATGISDAEQLILDKIKAGAKINGDTKYLPIAYINQAENEFLSNKVDLTDEQAVLIITKIDEAIDMMSDMGMVDIANIQNSEVALALLNLVSEVANEVDYEVSIDIANRSVNVKNPDGNTVIIAKNTVNQTGYKLFDRVSVVILAMLLVSIVSSIIFIITGRSNRRQLHKAYIGTNAIGAIYEE